MSTASHTLRKLVRVDFVDDDGHVIRRETRPLDSLKEGERRHEALTPEQESIAWRLYKRVGRHMPLMTWPTGAMGFLKTRTRTGRWRFGTRSPRCLMALSPDAAGQNPSCRRDRFNLWRVG
jgi:hypothetical protein